MASSCSRISLFALSVTEVQTTRPIADFGESGKPALVAGRSDESLMFTAASGKTDGLQMPPHEDHNEYAPLSAKELTDLKCWIDDGALWPTGTKIRRDSY